MKYRVIENDNSVRIELRDDTNSSFIDFQIERSFCRYNQKDLDLVVDKINEFEKKNYEFEFFADRRSDEVIQEDRADDYFGIQKYFEGENRDFEQFYERNR